MYLMGLFDWWGHQQEAQFLVMRFNPLDFFSIMYANDFFFHFVQPCTLWGSFTGGGTSRRYSSQLCVSTQWIFFLLCMRMIFFHTLWGSLTGGGTSRRHSSQLCQGSQCCFALIIMSTKGQLLHDLYFRMSYNYILEINKSFLNASCFITSAPNVSLYDCAKQTVFGKIIGY